MSTETIAGMPVHPAASVFPLLAEKELGELKRSIKKNGVLLPIVVYEGVLLDGRNRLRAVEALRAEGVEIECPRVEWKPTEHHSTPAEYICELNLARRHLTPDQIVAVMAATLPIIEAETATRKSETQFKPGAPTPNPTGRRGKQVDTKSSPPVSRRDSKEKHARSTVGVIAKKANVSMHKARQAVAVQKAVERGEVAQQEIGEVVAGKKKLRDVARKVKKSAPKAASKAKAKGDPVETPTEHPPTRRYVWNPQEAVDGLLSALWFELDALVKAVGVDSIMRGKLAATLRRYANDISDFDRKKNSRSGSRPVTVPAAAEAHP